MDCEAPSSLDFVHGRFQEFLGNMFQRDTKIDLGFLVVSHTKERSHDPATPGDFSCLKPPPNPDFWKPENARNNRAEIVKAYSHGQSPLVAIYPMVLITTGESAPIHVLNPF